MMCRFNLVDGSTTQITALASSDGSRRITTRAVEPHLVIVTMTSTASISTQSETLVGTG